jgi:hypothetical protein
MLWDFGSFPKNFAEVHRCPEHSGDVEKSLARGYKICVIAISGCGKVTEARRPNRHPNSVFDRYHPTDPLLVGDTGQTLRLRAYLASWLTSPCQAGNGHFPVFEPTRKALCDIPTMLWAFVHPRKVFWKTSKVPEHSGGAPRL